jgi:NAD(P)-dependent dehydrogenase (short-subunit alcohol dehydrogenase family)
MVRNLARAEGHPAEDYLSAQFIRRFQTPQDIAYAMAYLHTSRAMTGQALNIDGGTFFH